MIGPSPIRITVKVSALEVGTLWTVCAVAHPDAVAASTARPINTHIEIPEYRLIDPSLHRAPDDRHTIGLRFDLSPYRNPDQIELGSERSRADLRQR